MLVEFTNASVHSLLFCFSFRHSVICLFVWWKFAYAQTKSGRIRIEMMIRCRSVLLAVAFNPERRLLTPDTHLQRLGELSLLSSVRGAASWILYGVQNLRFVQNFRLGGVRQFWGVSRRHRNPRNLRLLSCFWRTTRCQQAYSAVYPQWRGQMIVMVQNIPQNRHGHRYGRRDKLVLTLLRHLDHWET